MRELPAGLPRSSNKPSEITSWEKTSWWHRELDRQRTLGKGAGGPLINCTGEDSHIIDMEESHKIKVLIIMTQGVFARGEKCRDVRRSISLLPCPASIQQRHGDETAQNKKACAADQREALRKAKGGLGDPGGALVRQKGCWMSHRSPLGGDRWPGCTGVWLFQMDVGITYIGYFILALADL